MATRDTDQYGEVPALEGLDQVFLFDPERDGGADPESIWNQDMGMGVPSLDSEDTPDSNPEEPGLRNSTPGGRTAETGVRAHAHWWNATDRGGRCHDGGLDGDRSLPDGWRTGDDNDLAIDHLTVEVDVDVDADADGDTDGDENDVAYLIDLPDTDTEDDGER